MASNETSWALQKAKHDQTVGRVGELVREKREVRDTEKVTVRQKGEELVVTNTRERRIREQTTWKQSSRK